MQQISKAETQTLTNKMRRSVAVAFTKMLGLSLLALMMLAAPVTAQLATGGSGTYRDEILWFSWGAEGQQITNGTTETNTILLDGNTLAVTCSVDGIDFFRENPNPDPSRLISYQPGNWQGDGFDDLYNINGTGGSNQLIVGLSTQHHSESVRFDFACSATLNGLPYAPGGLVIADGEQSLNVNGEYVQITPTAWTGGATPIFRILDRYRDCTTASTYARRTTNSIRLLGDPNNTVCSGFAQGGPMVVTYAEGVSEGTVEIRGGGKSAVVLGVFLPQTDFSDAPGYDSAVHASDASFTGGVPADTASLESGGVPVSGPGFALATQGQPRLRLGDTVDFEIDPLPETAAADGDGASDDGLPGPPVAAFFPDSNYSLDVACTGTGTVYGFIDFNRNSIFGSPAVGGLPAVDQPNERSTPAACSGGTATLNWTFPINRSDFVAGQSYVRLRIASVANEAAYPTGFAASGEVEDYPITLDHEPQLTLVKTVDNTGGGTATTDDWALTATGASATPTTITGTSGSTTVTDAFIPVDVYTLTEMGSGPGSYAASEYSCVLNGAAAVISNSIDLDRNDVATCTITNTFQLPEIGLSKTAGTPTGYPDGTFDVEYTLVVENTGEVTLNHLDLVDDLATQFGPAFVASGEGVSTGGIIDAPEVTNVSNTSTLAVAPAINAGYDGSNGSNMFDGMSGVLGVGDSITVTFTVRIDPNAAGAITNAMGQFENLATVTGDDPDGTGFSDASNNGEPPSANPGEDTGTPTPVTPPVATPQLDVAKSATTVGALLADGTFDVIYAVTVENTGNVTLDPVALVDDLTATDQLGSAFNGVTTPGAPVVSAGSISAGSTLPTANASYDGGVADAALVSTTDASVLIPGDSFVVTFTVNIDPNAASAPTMLQNTATATGTPPGGTPVTDDSDTDTDPAGDPDGTPNVPGGPGDPTLVTPPEPASVTLMKRASVSDVIIGQTVTYTIVATNLGDTSVGPVTIADTLPEGLIYTPETATVNGVAIEPDVAGRRLTWTELTLPAGPDGTIEVVLNVRIGPSAPFGNMVNTADILEGRTGTPLTESATAVVSRSPEAVFDCSDIIGKVFDDIDRDGYQDPIGENSAAITDQTYVGGKFDVIPDAPRQEHGLPGVRLVTTDGTIITTDEYGRYSVPCAALPGPIGENFTLKLDTNSLPTGYRMTTENPRTMRVTSGIMTEMNFRASIGRVVDVDLTASAFDAQHEPVNELVNGLDGLFAQINDTPSVLRITYFTNGESGQVADARLDALEDVIRRKWRRVGNYRLVIERTVTRLQ